MTMKNALTSDHDLSVRQTEGNSLQSPNCLVLEVADVCWKPMLLSNEAVRFVWLVELIAVTADLIGANDPSNRRLLQ